MLIYERVSAPKHDLIHAHPGCPNVHRQAIATAPPRDEVLLRRHERWRAALLREEIAPGQEHSEAKVGELEPAVASCSRARSHHEVVGLDVSVANLLGVQGRNRRADLLHPVCSLK